MSSFGSWLWGTNQIDEAVDKATSELLPAGAEDIALNLEICDQIRSKTAPANIAMRALKRRLNHKNPNVQLLALGLTDICVKNGGDHFLTEVASREFMDNLVSILKIPVLNQDVKNNILRLIQNWSVAFEGKPSLSYVNQVYRILNNEGFKFPPKDFTSANAAMVDTQTAPEWIDSDVCLRCRTPFTFTNRKHHCRNCGQVFDQACSSKSIPLPHFGITQDVRVCDGCYSKVSKKGERTSHRHSQSVHVGNSSRHRSARELADAELQRAIQLSLEESSRTTSGHRPGYVSSQPDPSRWQASEPPIVEHSSHPRRAKSLPPPDEEDEDLKAAIEASLREANAPKASAPEVLPTPQSEYTPRTQPQSSIKLPNYDLQPTESDAILRFSQQVEQAQASGRKDIVRYPDVSELYETASGLRSKLALSLDDTGKKEQLLTEMHEKMSQIVKLYDGLLSEQLSHPRWKTQSLANAPSPQQYQQANSVYSMGYNPVNGYTQWNQAQAPQASASPQQQAWYTQQQQAPVAEPAQYQYAPPQRQQQQSEHAQPGLSHQQSQPAYPQYQQPQQAQSYYASPTAPSEPYQLPSTVPISAVPYQTSTPQPQVSPTPYQSQPVTQPTLPVFVPQSPPITHYSPPTAPTPMAPSLPPTSPSLSRQNTISTYLPQTQTPVQSSASSSAPSSSSYLSRSNTITTSHSYHPQQQQQPQIIQQPSQPIQSPQQQLPAFPPVSALPVFPSAPTAAPQSMYQQPQQQPQPEREALLIEL